MAPLSLFACFETMSENVQIRPLPLEVIRKFAGEGRLYGILDACDEPEGVSTEEYMRAYLNLQDELIDELQCVHNNCDGPGGLFDWTINSGNSRLESGSAHLARRL